MIPENPSTVSAAVNGSIERKEISHWVTLEGQEIEIDSRGDLRIRDAVHHRLRQSSTACGG